MREDWIQPILDKAKTQGLERTALPYPETGGKIVLDGKEMLNFASNDYLDLSRHRHVMDCAREALDQYGIGATASRLVSGTLPIHEELEARLAKEKGYEAALVFGSGYMANAGTIPVLAEKHDAMLMVDEAHASGTFGPNGAGLVRELGLENSVTVSMGTMSKAMAGYGGFVACSKNLRNLLVSSARAFIYTTAPPPASIGAALGIMDVLESSPRLGAILQANADYFRSLLHAANLDTLQSQSQIIPIVMGENDKAVSISRKLRDQGIIASAIRPPTVPAGSARLRLSITLAHHVDDLEYAAEQIIETVKNA